MIRWLDEIVKNEIKKPLPILSFPGVQLISMTVKEMIESPENQANCMRAIADKFDSAASVSLMDLSVEAQAFGSSVKFSDSEVPTVIGMIVETEEDAENLKIPAVGDGRTGICIKAIELAKSYITDRPILAGVIGPFSLAGRLMGMTEIMVNCLVEPELTHMVLAKACEFIKRYILALKEAGANGIVIAEPAAGLLSPEVCEAFSSVYVKSIIEAVQDDQFIVIYHNCGNTLPLIDSLLGVGAKAYHFGNAVDIGAVLDKMPNNIPVLGNLSPADHFKGGTPESVAIATKEMLTKTVGHKNYIPSSGCDIPPQSPMENIEAFFASVKGFYSNH